ncbi:hypothetical protein ACJ41O_003677 [Fusarium nematophilum]
MANNFKVAILGRSTRNPRVGPKVAKFVKQTIHKDAASSAVDLSLVDIVDFKPPLFDEKLTLMQVPAYGSFAREHSRAWSPEITKPDGYILAIPEYNHGMSGGTKDAVDYPYNEWITKPALVISYGNHGGKHASGQLSEILTGMKPHVAAARPSL